MFGRPCLGFSSVLFVFRFRIKYSEHLPSLQQMLFFPLVTIITVGKFYLVKSARGEDIHYRKL
jgi:hypothetical protein